MKKALTLLLCICLLCTSLAGCDNSKTDPIGDNITHYTTEGKETKLVGDETLTGELSVNFMGGTTDSYIARAQKMYNELYPNVKLTIEKDYGSVGEEGYSTLNFFEKFKTLQTEIMAGKGPDVFLVMGEGTDPYKTMKAGAYADLASHFENDKNFNVKDFNEGVLYSGQFENQQYIVPISYTIPLFLTTQSIIDETGFEIDKCKDYFSTSEEIARVTKENKLGCTDEKMIFKFMLPYELLDYSGIDWIDYEAESVKIDTPQMKQAYEILKNDFFRFLRHPDGMYGADFDTRILEAKSIKEKQTMLAQISQSSRDVLAWHVRALTGLGEKPVVFPWRNVDGKIQASGVNNLAVSRNSKNVQNGYNFIKLLISPEFATVDALNESFMYELPLCKQTSREFFEAQEKGGVYQDDLNTYQLGEFPQELTDRIMTYLNEETEMSFSPSVGYTFRELMQPYLEGTKSYESCIKEAQSKLEIYVSE